MIGWAATAAASTLSKQVVSLWFVGEGVEKETSWFAGEGEERERERDSRLRALRGARPHTVGYIRGCDQEQGGVISPSGDGRGDRVGSRGPFRSRLLQGYLAHKKQHPPIGIP